MKLKKYFLIPLIVMIIAIMLGVLLGNFVDISIHPRITKLEFIPIFSHNVLISILILIGGIISFSLISHAILLFNGIVTGFVLAKLWNFTDRVNLYWHIIPHGIIELLAYIIFTGISLYVSATFYQYIASKFTKNRKFFIKKSFYKNTIISLLLGVFTLFLAAIIEVYLV